MKINILTLFPEMFSIFDHSIIGRARDNKIVDLEVFNIRDFTVNKHRKVDDYPYGGGAGMVMAPQPIVDCIRHVKRNNPGKVIFLGPRGKTFNQDIANELAKEENLIFLCGHYEGFDERIRSICDMEISIGDYVLTGGEIPAMVLVDSITRLIPGVINEESHLMDSFNSSNLLDYPVYTKPVEFQNMKVPDVLLSGHHENIRKWRLEQSIKKTKERRPDLLEKGDNNES